MSRPRAIVESAYAPIKPKHCRDPPRRLVAGWLAGKITRGSGYGLIGDLIVGLVGAFLGDWLLPRFGIHLGTGIVALIVNALIGAIVLLLVLRILSGGLRRRSRWGW
jgi:uncharacterized membrane protein YeaQ/YmgE (transglycosylase-associated protein family)